MENQNQSTGPKTEAGKAASSQNATKHGLTCSIFRITAGENEQEYRALQGALYQEHQPQTTTEMLIVERLVQSWWLVQRALRAQSHEDTNHKELALLIRYQTTHDRAFHNYLKQLKALQAERKAEERGLPELKQRELKVKVERAELKREREELLLSELLVRTLPKPDFSVPLAEAA